MPLLYYWRGDNYLRDLDQGAGFNLNQANPLMHEVDVGDSLWAFTRRPDKVYVLVAELVVSAKTMNPPGFKYGPYRLWGDLKRSRYFSPHEQADITDLVRGLSISARGDALGRAFQGHAAVRRLSIADHQVLAAYAQDLSLEPRAVHVPEEELEALVLSGDEAAVEQLLRVKPSGLNPHRRTYLVQQAARNRRFVRRLRDLYEGQCQICQWSPRNGYKIDLCEAHHVQWLCRGGQDELTNMVLVCPNHHRAVHRCDAPFDWIRNAFLFDDDVEQLAIARHELAA